MPDRGDRSTLDQLDHKISLDYDDEADVLYVSIGAPRPAISRPVVGMPNVALRYAFDDGALCGATIMWFSEYRTEELDAVLPFKVDWSKLRRTWVR